MDADTQRRLLNVNRSFYARFAREFADSRSTTQASLRRILSRIADGDAVLDVGCGDGRVARALHEMARSVEYTGVDASEAFVALALQRAQGLALSASCFVLADVADPGWARSLPRQQYSVVLALALIHHLPGADMRQRLVADMAALLGPSGTLFVSAWQFMGSERLRRKIVPWSTVGLDAVSLDEGDYLIDWQRGGSGLRYCHLLDEVELTGLCTSAGLTVAESFLADNGLNLYVEAHKQGPGNSWRE